MATGRKTGGRKKGSKNKLKVPTIKQVVEERVQEIANSAPLTPLEVMLAVMNGTGKFTDKQIDAAKAAAPYVHAKKVEQQNTHVFAQFGERLDQMNRRDKDYTGK